MKRAYKSFNPIIYYNMQNKNLFYMLTLEMRMLFRNHAPRASLIGVLFFLLVGVMLYVRTDIESFTIYKYFSIPLITGAVINQYIGFFLASWSDEILPGLLTRPTNLRTLIRVKLSILFFLNACPIFLILVLGEYFPAKYKQMLWLTIIFNFGFGVILSFWCSLHNYLPTKANTPLTEFYKSQGTGNLSRMLRRLLLFYPVLVLSTIDFLGAEKIIIFEGTMSILLLAAPSILVLGLKYWYILFTRLLRKRKALLYENLVT